MRMKLAEALVNAGDLTRGAEAYARLVKEPAARPEAEYGLGRIAALKGDWKGAIEHQQRAFPLHVALLQARRERPHAPVERRIADAGIGHRTCTLLD